MTRNKNHDECGSIALAVITTLLLVAVGVLVYILITENSEKSARGTSDAEITETVAAPRNQFVQPGEVVPPIETQNPPSADDTDAFDDGLGTPERTIPADLDEFGAGLGETKIYYIDINNDRKPDRIIRTRIDPGNAHYYDEYEIALNTGTGFDDITPDGFYTVHGADCALQRIRFTFRPKFRAIKISRPIGDTYITPTPAVYETYELVNDEIIRVGARQMPAVCDVTKLFGI